MKSERESRRLSELERYAVLDTPPEAAFDDIVMIAAQICEAPMALISLVDSTRQWFKAKVGLGVTETPREVAFCAHAIESDDVLLVPDASKDARFAQNPLVTGDLHLRFYAGAPLQTPSGAALGTLCVLDRKPRTLTPTQQSALEALGRQVMRQLELRRALEIKRSEQQREVVMLEFSDRLHDLEEPDAIIALAARTIGQTLLVTRAGYGHVNLAGRALTIEHDWSDQPGASLRGAHALAALEPWLPTLEGGQNVIVPEIVDQGGIGRLCQSAGARALISVPILEKNQWVAWFYAFDAKPRSWTSEDVAFMKAIAERTRHAVERRRAEHNVRVLAASLHGQVEDRTRERDRLWLLSRDGFLIADSNGVWLRVNPAWGELLGWSDDDLLGHTSEWMEHPDDVAATRAEVTRLSAGRPTSRFENRFRARDGSFHWLAWTAVQSENLLFCVARDITHERAQSTALQQAEEQLRQSQKMEAVGQLTGGLAHDFNNLLAGISGSLQLLQSRLAQGRLSDADRLIHAAQGAAKRAAALTHRLLAFSRRQTLDPKTTDVNRLIAGMSELLQRSIGPSITFEIVAAGGLWNAMIDPGQLENALLNLCINARDAMPDGGKLTVETANRWFDERTAREREIEPGQYVSLCVSDTGTGMTADVVARAFEPFFTTKPIGLGTGLGLSMVYGFARQSGGQVRIDSEIGSGTTVCLYLPRHAGAASASDLEPSRPEPSSNALSKTLLVVDDEPTVRMIVADIINDMGCTALEAGTAAEALKILDSGARVDLMITDVGLPGGMNGRQLAEAVQVSRPALKILFITGYAENAALSHDQLGPGMHVLTKPFAVDELSRRLTELMGESAT